MSNEIWYATDEHSGMVHRDPKCTNFSKQPQDHSTYQWLDRDLPKSMLKCPICAKKPVDWASPGGTAQRNQMIAGIKPMISLWSATYKGLLEEGVPVNVAILFTAEMIKAAVTAIFSRPPSE